jgi:hypothetical protein
MPRWCAGDRCGFPSLGLHGGPGGIKKCPDCGKKIHDVCAFEDDAAGLSEMNVCPDCWDARKPPAEEDDLWEQSHLVWITRRSCKAVIWSRRLLSRAGQRTVLAVTLFT